MRLDKFLTECGIGSRSECKKIIRKGKIKVNEKKIKKGKTKINPKKDKVEYKNKEMDYKKFRYYAMNKPAGYITATEDSRHKTVMEILPEWVVKKDLVPVGRLDKDTEGLLIFTNDGKFVHELIHPKKEKEKKYYIETKKEVSDLDIEKLKEGVIIGDGYRTKKAKVRKISSKKIYITITEGKYHQIKEMLKAVDNKVLYLQRVRFGNLELSNLKKGKVREISKKDLI
ncbi:MAG: pseudouridine synthase [Fusobacteriota bacterium]